MTRETKIGLLVGLAFIIVIGILLSDHMAATTEPAQAALNDAAPTARSAIVVPNQNGNTAVVPHAINPRDVAPPGPVPTRTDLTQPQQQVVRDIVIGGPGNTGVQGPGNTAQIAVGPTALDPGTTGHATGPGTAGGTATTQLDPRLEQIAQVHGEQLINVGTNDRASTGHTSRDAAGTGSTTTVREPASTAKTYTVQAGDTLGHIASKTLGANTKANRDAIAKANQLSDPNKVVIGQVYTIPSPTVAISNTGNTGNTAGSSTRVLPLQQVQPTNPREARRSTSGESGSYTYVVKPGDTGLWGIAREQLGTPSAVAAIKELNKDVLKGGDVIRVGMRLKMPSKPVASAN